MEEPNINPIPPEGAANPTSPKRSIGLNSILEFDIFAGVSLLGYLLIGCLLYWILESNTGNAILPLNRANDLVIQTSDSLAKVHPKGRIHNFQIRYCSRLMDSDQAVFRQYFLAFNTSTILGIIASIISGLCLFLIAKDGWNGENSLSLKWVFGISVAIASCCTVIPQVFMHENNVASAANNYNLTRAIQLKTMSDQIRFCCDSLGTDTACRDSLLVTFNRIATIKMTVPSLDLSKVKNNQFTSLEPAK